ncbi:carotenoid ester lipase precursor, partial [Moniliophthora roreri]
TEAQVKEYVKTEFVSTIPDADLDRLLKLYPQDIIQGSPYNTGIFNAISPQFKRFASFQGDAVFQAPRRFFLESLSGKQPIWSFLSKRLKALPILGSVHASDLLNVYGGGELADYLIRFAATLDPNGNTGINWPQYTKESPTLLQFQDGLIPLTLTQDTYRKEAMQALTEIMLVNPV